MNAIESMAELDIIMLDNMSIKDMKEIVMINSGRSNLRHLEG